MHIMNKRDNFLLLDFLLFSIFETVSYTVDICNIVQLWNNDYIDNKGSQLYQ